MKIVLNRKDLLDLQISLKKEYLLTNGMGGYSSSTIHDCHTRKYHGLLVLPVPHLNKVYNFLSKLEVNVIVDNKEFHLSTNKFPKVYSPTGHKYVERFELEDFPVTTYRIGDIEIKKTIIMPKGKNTVLVKYDVVKSEVPLTFEVTPLMAYREIHALSKQNMDISPRTFFEKNGFKFDPYPGLPAIYVQSSVKSVFYPSPTWWENLEYLKERNRGYEYQEDLFAPGIFEIKLTEGKSMIFRASLDEFNGNIASEWTKAEENIAKESKKFETEKEPLQSYKKQASQFIYSDKNDDLGIIAGYHWFREWGRDTLVALPGLTWMSGDKKSGLKILRKYADLVMDGLVPTNFSDDGNHHYKSIDPSLIIFNTVQKYIEHTNDKANITKSVLPGLIKIIEAFIDGRVPNVGMGDDAFLYINNRHEPLTWMDAKVDGQAVTLRDGAPVEINALWYNALRFLYNDYPEKLDEILKSRIHNLIQRFEENFETKFWNEKDQCLLDTYYGTTNSDQFIRPNQLFAIGLPYICISENKAENILNTVKQHLETPYGFRTLSPRNPNYNGEYKGLERLRDLAYHNGMVWPWMTGIFMDAMLKYKSKEEVGDYIKSTFWKLWDKHIDMYGLFQISELFRPNPPQVAKGCMAQAWSLAEIIRILDTLK